MTYPTIADIEAQNATSLPVNNAPVDGGEVTALDGLTVKVSAGSTMIGARRIEWSDTALNVQDGDPTMDRLDLIVVGVQGGPRILTGSASTRPSYPSVPPQTATLAGVYVPPRMRDTGPSHSPSNTPTNFTTLDASLIDDKRA